MAYDSRALLRGVHAKLRTRAFTVLFLQVSKKSSCFDGGAIADSRKLLILLYSAFACAVAAAAATATAVLDVRIPIFCR